MRQDKRYWQLPALVALVVLAIAIVRAQKDTPYQHDTGFIFGTVYHVTYQSDENLKAEIESELKKVDNSLSMFNPQSIISQVNQNHDVKVDDMFAEVFGLAEKVSKETDGAFDITVGPLVNAWGFGFKHNVMPDKHTVDSLKQIIGFDKVAMKNRHIVKTDNRVMLDCNAIAKGFGTDMVARMFQQKGIKNYMVEIGGEIVTSGNSEKRVPWRIGVTKPTDDSLNVNEEIQTVLNVSNTAMATSGNYRNFYYKGGKKYAHTIDPKTGFPVQHSILSSTVLAPNCATADAFATSFMVMGLDRAKVVLKRHPELMAYFIYADEKGKHHVWYSPSLQSKIAR